MARSIVNQGLYMQLESTPGTAATDAMRRYLSLRGNVGWDVQKERMTASGFRAATAENTLTEMGTIDLTATQDYNGFMPLLAGALGMPTTTELDDGVYEHVFLLVGDATQAIDVASHTVMWGDTEQALQAVNSVFHGLSIGVQRTSLSVSANGILNMPTSATLPTTGVENVPMMPVRASTYCAYLDDAWADLGTTKLLNLYSADVQFGDRFAPDWIVDCDLPGHAGLLEAEGVTSTVSASLGFDAAAQAQIDAAQNGELKFLRLEATGPEIEGTTENHMMSIDTAVSLAPQSTGQSSVSPAVVVNFDGEMMVDPTSGNVARVTLVNGLETL